MNRKYILLGLAACSLAACKPNLDPEKPSAGDADFSRYVAVGNSLTAGFADGTLYRSGQQNSYPVMLAEQFKLVGGGDFKVPLLPGESGWPIAPASGYLPKRVLGSSTDCKGVTSLGPVLYSTVDTTGSAASVAAEGPYNNTGVPGIRCIDYTVPLYGILNPYARRFFANPAAAPVSQLSLIKPTFFTCWVGNNDVLGYATSGGSGKSSDGTPADANSISSTTLFTNAFDAVISTLTADGAKGVVIGIPDVTSIPFFTTIPGNGLVLDATQATQLTAAYGGQITFTAGQNYFVVQDTTVPVLKCRKLKAGELLTLTLPQDSLKCAGWGSAKPIPMRYVLDEKEIGAVRTATTTFNLIMQQSAEEHGLVYVDIGTYLKTVASGIVFNGVSFNTQFVRGGAFSLDGVHLTPRGYALVANEIIRHINAAYRSSIPQVDVTARSGILFP